jgi:hypothetical protein
MALAHSGSQVLVNGGGARLTQQNKEQFLHLIDEYIQWRREAERAGPSARPPKQLF